MSEDAVPYDPNPRYSGGKLISLRFCCVGQLPASQRTEWVTDPTIEHAVRVVGFSLPGHLLLGIKLENLHIGGGANLLIKDGDYTAPFDSAVAVAVAEGAPDTLTRLCSFPVMIRPNSAYLLTQGSINVAPLLICEVLHPHPSDSGDSR